MKTQTKTIHIDAPRDDVFEYVSNVENLPNWAVNFCSDVRTENGGYVLSTAHGDTHFKIAAERTTGVVDMQSGMTAEDMKIWPARVMGLSDGTTVFAFTCVQYPGLPDEAFSAICKSLDEELDILRGVFA